MVTKPLPKGAAPLLRTAATQYARVRRYGVRGTMKPSQEYLDAREGFLETLAALEDLGVPQRVTGTRLGVDRVTVSQWLSKRKNG